MSTTVKTIKCRKLDNKSWQVEIQYNNKTYSDNCTLLGLKKSIENIDKKSKQFIVQSAMIKAIQSKTKKEASNARNDHQQD